MGFIGMNPSFFFEWPEYAMPLALHCNTDARRSLLQPADTDSSTHRIRLPRAGAFLTRAAWSYRHATRGSRTMLCDISQHRTGTQSFVRIGSSVTVELVARHGGTARDKNGRSHN
jgi:hypothetical protein